VGCQDDFRRRIKIGEFELAFDDPDQTPYAHLGVMAGAQGCGKRVLVEYRRGAIGADISHRHATARSSSAGSGRRSSRKNMASCRLSAMRAALAWRAIAASGSISSLVVCSH